MKTGITGGIGSGKSYVSQRLQARGISVYDCDSAAKRLLSTSPHLRQQLAALVGSLDKRAIARYLLHSEQNARAIDAIIHPAVFRDFQQSRLQWMESAILYESGIHRLVDRVIVVTAPLELRIQRVMQRDGISRQQVLQWMQRQWPQEALVSRADIQLVNDGIADVDQQLDEILRGENTTKPTNQ